MSLGEETRPRNARSGTEHVEDGVQHLAGDGEVPYAGLVLACSDNLYGTTSTVGKYTYYNAGCGTVFKLARDPGRALGRNHPAQLRAGQERADGPDWCSIKQGICTA